MAENDSEAGERAAGPQPWWQDFLLAGFPVVVVGYIVIGLCVGNELSLPTAFLPGLSGCWLAFFALLRLGSWGRAAWGLVGGYALFLILREIAFPAPLQVLTGDPLVPPSSARNALEFASILGGCAACWLAPQRVVQIILIPFTLVFFISAVSELAELQPRAAVQSDLLSRFQGAFGEAPSPSDRPDVIHLILDGYQTQAFEKTLEEPPGLDLDGFVMFRNNVANYMATRESFASIFSASLYDRAVTIPEWRERARESGLLHELRGAGYRTYFFGKRRHIPSFDFDFSAASVDVWEELYSDRGRDGGTLSDLSRLAVLRLSPTVLGVSSYNAAMASPTPPGNVETYSTALLFRQAVRGLEAMPRGGNYLGIHVLVPHMPFVLDERARYVGNKKSNAYLQCLAANTLVSELLRELERLGRYDESLIVIHADHGASWETRAGDSRHAMVTTEPMGGLLWMTDKRGTFYETADRWLMPLVRSRSRALLLIKPPKSSGPLRVDESPTELLDLTRTVLETVGIGAPVTAGMNVLADSIPADRSRLFFTYDFPNVRRMREYRVQAGLFEKGKVSKVRH